VVCDSIIAVSAADSLPDDIELLKQLVRTRDAELARARAEASGAEALITHLRLAIEKLHRRSEGPNGPNSSHWINSSADAMMASGTVKPRSLAVVFRLTTISNFVGRSIGRSDGWVPLSTRSTK